MRIALIYPPPWKIAATGEPDDPVDGPPVEYRQKAFLDGDFHELPHGLMSLAAQAMRAGHQVKLLNLSSFAWREVDDIVRRLDADLFGMSCWTANRRGVALVARAIKEHHPNAHVIIGGPHATPLATQYLAHYPHVDTVALGEAEDAFLELIGRLERGEPTTGIAGTAYRIDGRIERGPHREPVAKLDSLASPYTVYRPHIFMTSRGCAWDCTFCGAATTWGRGFRANSVERVLDDLEDLVTRLPQRLVLIKDDTFTTNRKRVVELCRGIRRRKLKFFWSCDTRVDVLSDEVLYEMRLAGCERISLGVESGSQKILDNIHKKITVDEIVASTELARKYGISIRYFMMLGARGETLETFRETLAFLERAKPNQYVFALLTFFPGTPDFDLGKAAGILDEETYFRYDFREFVRCFDTPLEDWKQIIAWVREHFGVVDHHRPSVAEREAVLALVGDDHAGALVDLAEALYQERRYDEAEGYLRRALALDHPMPGIVHNFLACIAHARGDVRGMLHAFRESSVDPCHHVLVVNRNRVRAWLRDDGPAQGLPLALEAENHHCKLATPWVQPSYPGRLPRNLERWDPPKRPKAPPTPTNTEVRAELRAGPRRLPLVAAR